MMMNNLFVKNFCEIEENKNKSKEMGKKSLPHEALEILAIVATELR